LLYFFLLYFILFILFHFHFFLCKIISIIYFNTLRNSMSSSGKGC
jgi:hypothetical protein